MQKTDLLKVDDIVHIVSQDSVERKVWLMLTTI